MPTLVVSYRNSTSNHNVEAVEGEAGPVVSYRNSTSNHNRNPRRDEARSVVSYRNSTSNHNSGIILPIVNSLYLIEILHQTTTNFRGPEEASKLYLIEILHQTTTDMRDKSYATVLYLIEILHQTTTTFFTALFELRCILSKFYIKPQRRKPVCGGIGGCILSKFYIKPQH